MRAKSRTISSPAEYLMRESNPIQCVDNPGQSLEQQQFKFRSVSKCMGLGPHCTGFERNFYFSVHTRSAILLLESFTSFQSV